MCQGANFLGIPDLACGFLGKRGPFAYKTLFVVCSGEALFGHRGKGACVFGMQDCGFEVG